MSKKAEQAHKKAHETILDLLKSNEDPEVRKHAKYLIEKSDRAITFSVTIFETENGNLTTAATVADPHLEDDTATPCVLFLKDWMELHASMMDQFFEVIKDRALGTYQLNETFYNFALSDDATKH